MNTLPQQISAAEWREIAALPSVREAWGLADADSADEWSRNVYGVKYDFVSGGPGYSGDLFILQGDSLDASPMMLRRSKLGELDAV